MDLSVDFTEKSIDYSLNKKKFQSNNKGFGISSQRFYTSDLSPTPGVGAYSISEESPLILKSPSFSSKGFGNSFLSSSKRIPILKDKGVPGPASYELPSISTLPYYKRRPSNFFIPSGDGRVPFPKPNNNPGPLDYSVNYEHGQSPVLKRHKSSTFLSKTKRDSFFDHQPESPPPGVYKVEKSSLGVNHDLQWSRSSFTRFQDIGKDNFVPPPTKYFNDNEFDDSSRRSLRSAGNYRGKYLGKQNEKPKQAIHTFGADVDRFKNSVYGRLDLIAQIPGPGSYYSDNLKSPSSNSKSNQRPKTTAHPDR